MTPQALHHLIANGEDTRHQFKRDFAHVDNPLLVGHAFHILPYQGLGTGIPRAAQAWENIALQDNPADNQFKAVVQRPLPRPGTLEKAESKAESKVESKAESLDIRVLTALHNGGALSKAHIAEALGLRNVTGQLNAQVRALLNHGHIEMTLPEKPNSRLQQYRLTQVGMQVLATAPSAPAHAPDQRNLSHD